MMFPVEISKQLALNRVGNRKNTREKITENVSGRNNNCKSRVQRCDLKGALDDLAGRGK